MLATLYTREQGKLRAAAKGARRSTSRLVGHLEPLTVLNMAVHQGQNLEVIAQAQVVNAFGELKATLEGIGRGLYVAELLDSFGAEASPNPSLYDAALETLAVLERRPNADLPLRCFELRLLQESGLAPELYCCVACRRELEPGRHRYSPDAGGVLCPDCAPDDTHRRPLSLRALKVLRLLDRAPISQLPGLPLDGALALELKTILGGAISYWLNKELRSPAFLEHLRHAAADAG